MYFLGVVAARYWEFCVEIAPKVTAFRFAILLLLVVLLIVAVSAIIGAYIAVPLLFSLGGALSVLEMARGNHRRKVLAEKQALSLDVAQLRKRVSDHFRT